MEDRRSPRSVARTSLSSHPSHHQQLHNDQVGSGSPLSPHGKTLINITAQTQSMLGSESSLSTGTRPSRVTPTSQVKRPGNPDPRGPRGSKRRSKALKNSSPAHPLPTGRPEEESPVLHPRRPPTRLGISTSIKTEHLQTFMVLVNNPKAAVISEW